jgi:hypothetical protein
MTKHEKSFVNFDSPYERNIIGMRGIIIFGVGLFLLIVITFGLMWVLEVVMENDAKEAKDGTGPMALSKEERLPPEPRLQVAPGFGVEGKDGWVNLELRPPGEEWKVLHELWKEEWETGQKDEKTGTVITLPIDAAKERFLEESAGAKADEAAQKMYEESRRFVSASSAGRTKTDTRR